MVGGDETAVLHIGAGKCGSSSLQRALSLSPEIRAGRHAYLYCAVGPTGKVLNGPALTTAAGSSDFGYVTSAELPPDRDPVWGRAAGDGLGAACRRGQRPILSNEGWIYAAPAFTEQEILAALGIRPRVLAFVRPPVEWLNSAWWQWGAWSGVKFETWVRNSTRRADWSKYLREWAAVPGVASVEAHLVGEDVVATFLACLNATSTLPPTRENMVLPASVLRFFQRNRSFRPGPHDSRIDFVLARLLRRTGAAAPWVISPELATWVMGQLRASIEDLPRFLGPADAARMASDPRWHDPRAYDDREREPADDPGDITLADELISELLATVLPARKP